MREDLLQTMLDGSLLQVEGAQQLNETSGDLFVTRKCLRRQLRC
jgi:hypothetical protein